MDQYKVGSDDDQLARLFTAAGVELERRAEALGATRESQERIFAMQREKQDLMLELKRLLRVIDGKEAYEFHPGESDRVVQFDEQRGVYFVGEVGSQEQATLGEVLFDNDFGANYVMDFADTHIPRQTRKRFALEQTKRQLRDLLNKQIITEESHREDVPERVREIYQGLENKRERTEAGFLAEQVIEYLLKRLELEDAIQFRFEIADVYQDVAQKIDFIIRIQKRSRGVQVDASDAETIGIQFTMNEERTRFKKEQIVKAKQEGLEGVDDLVLVTIPIEHIYTIFYQWDERRRDTGKTAGGPVAFLLAEEKEALVRGLFGGLFGTAEMEEYVHRATGVFSLDQDRVRDEEGRLNMSWMTERRKSSGRILNEKRHREAQQRRAARVKRTVPNAQGAWAHVQPLIRKMKRKAKDLHTSWKEEVRRWEIEPVSPDERERRTMDFERRRDTLNKERTWIGNMLQVRTQNRKKHHEELILRLKEEYIDSN